MRGRLGVSLLGARGHFCHSYTPDCDEYRPGDPQTTPTSRAEAEGYRGGIGENIAADSAPGVTPQSMFGQWRDSPGHNDNMLDRHGITTYVFGMGFALGYPGRARARATAPPARRCSAPGTRGRPTPLTI